MDHRIIPFEVGQEVEIRSFLKGYRGAWFRCKIKGIIRKKETWLALEYIDFPDEKIGHTKLYQKGSNSKGQKKMLMVRPRFPDVHHESQMPDMKTISEVVVIINDDWKVGDLVDWWTDGCYWSARITEKLGDDRVKIDLPPPPAGEGLTYEVFCKDLRPSLDWSVHEGWELLIPKNLMYYRERERVVGEIRTCIDDSEHHFSCARIVKPFIKALKGNLLDRRVIVAGGSSNLIDKTISEDKKDVQLTAGASTEHDGNESSKKQCILLNSTSSDTIEDAILDFEELICRVKWLRGILEVGMPVSSTARSSWKFVEDSASSKP